MERKGEAGFLQIDFSFGEFARRSVPLHEPETCLARAGKKTLLRDVRHTLSQSPAKLSTWGRVKITSALSVTPLSAINSLQK